MTIEEIRALCHALLGRLLEDDRARRLQYRERGRPVFASRHHLEDHDGDIQEADKQAFADDAQYWRDVLAEGDFDAVSEPVDELLEGREVNDVERRTLSVGVNAWKAGGASASPPAWIQARPELTAYFRALGNDGFKLDDYQDLQEAADFIPIATCERGDEVRLPLEGLLNDCGWAGITTENEDDTPMASSAYALWWDDAAPAVASELSNLIKRILADA